MRRMFAAVTLIIVLLIIQKASAFLLSSTTSSSTATATTLLRTVNTTTVALDGSTPAFWAIGAPFVPGEVPTGSIVTAKVGATSVPINCGARKLHHGGGSPANLSLDWAQCVVDFTGVTLSTSSSATLTLYSQTG